MATLAETCRVLDELKGMFAADDDPDLLSRVLQNVSAAEASWARRRAEVVSVIDALQGHISTLEEEIVAYQEGRYDGELAQTEIERKRLLGEIDALQAAKKNLEQQLAEVEAETRSRQDGAVKNSNEIESVNIATRRMINLYSLISNIDWSYDTSQDLIKGTAFLRDLNQVKPFQFPATDDGAVPPDVVNAIWDVMWLNYVEREE